MSAGRRRFPPRRVRSPRSDPRPAAAAVPDAEAGGDADARPDGDAEAEYDGDADADADVSAEAEAEAGADADVSAEAEAEAGGDADAGADADCRPSGGIVACGDGPCDLASTYCCGGTGWGWGTCLGHGAFCGVGGIVKITCDDGADCASGEICCVEPNDEGETESPWRTRCRVPEPIPSPPCGQDEETGVSYESLCTCDEECAPSVDCSPAWGVGLAGYSACQWW